MSTAAVLYREAQWRVTGTMAWSAITTAAPTGELALSQLSPNISYDVRVRNVAGNGMRSDWATFTITAPDNTQRLSQAHLAMLRVGGIGSAWTGFSISFEAAAGTPATATISCTAGTLQDGATNPSYAASSASVTGTNGATVSYYLYYDDPTGAGGTLPLGVTTAYSDLSANQGRIFVGQADVLYPTSGSSSGGGSPGGGGCPVVGAWVIRLGQGEGRYALAGEVCVGDYLLLANGQWGRVSHSKTKRQPCVRMVGDCGKSLSCSRSAPLGLCGGGTVLAAEAQGAVVRIRPRVAVLGDRIAEVQDIGEQWVQHITCENDFFWTGDEQDCLFAHHNLKPVDPPI